MEIGKVIIASITLLIAAASLAGTARAEVSYDVMVVRGDVPTDYIIASIYASTEKVPLVLVNPDMMQDQIRSEMKGYRDKGYQLLLIIGGESAISTGIEDDLKGMGFIVNRLWDWSRYGTAARVAIDLWGESDEVVVANGEDYSGFLIAQGIALEKGVPILFMNNGTVPAQTSDALRKLGAKSAVLVSSEKSALPALSALGLSVQSVETIKPRLSETEEDVLAPDPTAVIIFALIAAAAIVLAVRQIKNGKASVFVMTEDEERIIEILRASGKTEQNKLASMTGFSKPRISRLLRRLEESGIIEREKFKKTLRVRLNPKIA